jgi:23S rRNA maturation mini-RNase III
VYGLMVREHLACEANRPVGTLHKASVDFVRAEAQSAAMVRLLPLLTEAEPYTGSASVNGALHTYSVRAGAADAASPSRMASSLLI